jgi:hypothetical protein
MPDRPWLDAEGAPKKGRQAQAGGQEGPPSHARHEPSPAQDQVPLNLDWHAAPTDTPEVMEGGIAIFLLFLIIVAGLALAFFFGGLGGGLQAYRERRASGRKPPRPTHAVVHDDGESRAEPGNQL